MIKLITREECSYCDQAKTLLKQHNLEYSELQIGKDIEREMVLEQYPGYKVLQIVVVDNKPIGGYNELLDYIFPPLKLENS